MSANSALRKNCYTDFFQYHLATSEGILLQLFSLASLLVKQTTSAYTDRNHSYQPFHMFAHRYVIFSIFLNLKYASAYLLCRQMINGRTGSGSFQFTQRKPVILASFS